MERGVMADEAPMAARVALPDTAPPDAVFAGLQTRLFRIAFSVCGDAHLAEEAVAEAFARSWPALRRGQVQDPGAYVRRAVLNVLKGRFRRLALERRVQERRSGEGRGPADPVTGLADRDAVLRALWSLPERQRAVVALRFYEGLTEEEVAREMRVPLGTVKSTGSRAMARLRVLLEEERHD
jgi:RNA polymerase sigma factor (sigma-70 family)